MMEAGWDCGLINLSRDGWWQMVVQRMSGGAATCMPSWQIWCSMIPLPDSFCLEFWCLASAILVWLVVLMHVLACWLWEQHPPPTLNILGFQDDMWIAWRNWFLEESGWLQEDPLAQDPRGSWCAELAHPPSYYEGSHSFYCGRICSWKSIVNVLVGWSWRWTV